ncbi:MULTISPECIES: acyl-CoA thioesterase [Actinokineospora]|uniref:Thioesterase n=1 Tax=Actinokineospora fastidiosa TaxID=1816 RepID=A0A918GN26_9PSEU|nr:MULTISPECIES: acyl-CoA thioesterase [Actinokineospora]UVS77262.1 acyl-CoA thioester hydrolase, YbgC/YbaW family [Actinokineospora sp. UTMC 2448]GGS44527.1 thioesterase [Actinokineospora fastidiosa]
MAWSIRIPVRSYELDALGHLNQAVYHQYAEVARVEGFAAAGCHWSSLIEAGTAPVLLSATIDYRREIRAGESVDVTCEVKFGAGKTFRADSTITKLDGTVSAEITCVIGVMDLARRKLVADPRAALEAHGFDLGKLD